MILIRRYKKLFKTKIPHAIIQNTSDVQFCNNYTTSICKVKEWMQRNIEALNHSVQVLNALLFHYKRSKYINSCTGFLLNASYNGPKFPAAVLGKVDYSKDDINTSLSAMSPTDAEDTTDKSVYSSTKEKKHVSSASDIRFIHPRDMNLEQLYLHLDELESKGKNSRGVLRKIFMAVCKGNDTEEVNRIMRKINSNNLKWSPGMKICLLDHYVRNEMLDEALSVLHELQSQFAHFKIDNFKIIHFAIALVKQNKIDEAFDAVGNSSVNQTPNVNNSTSDLLSILVTKDSSNHTVNMIKLLMERGYCKDPIRMLRYLVLVKVLRGDIKAAVDVFRTCVKEYNHTPMKQELLVEIVKSPPDKSPRKLLRSVYDLIVQVHGRPKADVNLAIAFCLCNRVKELQSLLQKSHILDVILLRQVQYLKDDDVVTVTLRMLENVEHAKGINLKSLCSLALRICNEGNYHTHASELEKRIREKGIKIGEDSQKTG